MSAFTQAARELLGLFVEDGSLALAILAVVVAAALLAAAGVPKLLIGGLLLAGALAVLAENVLRAQRCRGAR
ncbi:MAG TPA: hypothetical protein VKW08_28260 [Xanthobacteraceae bacterium]|jgi:hypothetical protein|nr:hypothetical protein [Xanthobacteraceae bacterium]